MILSNYRIYSVVSVGENEHFKKLDEILGSLEELHNFEKESDVKKWLSEKFCYNEKKQHYKLGQYVTMKVTTGEKYFNVTVTGKNKVKSYNFSK